MLPSVRSLLAPSLPRPHAAWRSASAAAFAALRCSSAAASATTSASTASSSRSYSTYRMSGRSAIPSAAGSLFASSASCAGRSPLAASSALPSLSSSPFLSLGGVRHATKKAGGSSKNSNDSIGKRLGLKKSAGQPVKIGQILVRQRGMKVHPGRHVGCGRDGTLFALSAGRLGFSYLSLPFHRRKRARKFVHVLADGETQAQLEAESAGKSAHQAMLVSLHRQGIWLPSPTMIKARLKNKLKNEEKISAEKAALEEAQKGSDSAALKQHPLFRLQAEAAKKTATKL